jgi:glycosyltransferase involved in cell wall biosynthesis
MNMSFSLIIPAYNEEKRIENFIKNIIDFKKRNSFIKEIVVVDDGSTDKTEYLLKKYQNDIKILKHPTNKGKGAAIKTGVFAADEENIIFMDADNSTNPNQIPKLREALKNYPVVIGSRKEKKSRIIKKQPMIRIFLGKIFNLTANILFPDLRIFDTLCGFKGMRNKEGKLLFKEMISERWVFDVEMLIRARKMGYKIGIVPITWKHEGNSKMKLGMNNVKMLFDLLKLRILIK